MTLKGRHWVMLWLAVFLVVAAIVQVRQTASIQAARRVAALRQERANLEAREADLERRIRDASSRPVLGQKAQLELGLHFPRDSEQAPLPLPLAPGPGAP
jgi:cell division protein FtsB